MQPREKLAHGVQTHTALETECIECGHYEAREPTPTFFGFPEPGFRVAVAALHGLPETMHTAFGKARLVGNASHALGGIGTRTVENPQTFRPKSHVGRFSEGCLNSWRNSVPQRT
jgi:hypothetical protein